MEPIQIAMMIVILICLAPLILLSQIMITSDYIHSLEYKVGPDRRLLPVSKRDMFIINIYKFVKLMIPLSASVYVAYNIAMKFN